MNCAVKLSSHQKLWLVICSAKQDDLSITTTYNDLISTHSSNRLDTFGASIDVKSERFVLDLESKEVTTLRTCEKIVLSVLTEGHACVVSNNSACVNQII